MLSLARNGEEVEAFFCFLCLWVNCGWDCGLEKGGMVCGEVEREEVGRFFRMSVRGLGQ
jgi:hypothetical protein